MKRLSLLVAALAFVLGACERHSWDETKKLYEPHHGEHGGGHDEGKGGEHAEGGKKEGEGGAH